MIKKIIIFSTIIVLFAFQALAKDATEKTTKESAAQNLGSQSMKRIHPPSFFPMPTDMIMPIPPPQVKIPVNEQAIQIKKVEIKVQVSGLESETSTLITFYNPNGRVLEGELEFPLQNDATVVGYALDVNGKMIDGVIVSKEKARVVLETEIRKGVDPGIVEHVKGNFFRTRLYPIPALGERSIRITSVAPLSLFKEDAAMHIPLPIGIMIPSLSIEVQVNNPNVKPEIGGFGNLTFTNWKNNFTAQTKLNNVTPDNDLFINLPKIPARKISTEKFGDEVFVAISELPNYDQGPKLETPKQLNIFWDASSSRKPESVRRDREFLVALFKEWKALHIQLSVFRNEVEVPMDFEVHAGQADKLFAYLEKLAYDGATNLSKLDFHKHEMTATNILFTDGLATLGDSPPQFGGAPVYVISSDTSRDAGLQRFLTNVTGGLFVDLTVMDSVHAVKIMTHPQLSILRIESEKGALSEVQSQFLVSAKRANIYARLNKNTEITIVYGMGNKEVLRSKINLTKNDAPEGHLIARSWAASRAMELAVFADRNEHELLSLGRKYNLVTPGTSLIVLERVDQYLSHEIIPPETMPEWREQYYALLKNRQNEKLAEKNTKIEQVVMMWNERVAWWDKKFPRTHKEEFKGASKSTNDGRLRGAEPAVSMSAAAPQMDIQRSAGVQSELSQRRKSKMLSKLGPEGSGGGEKETAAEITIKEWNPNTPYLKEIETKGEKHSYETYLAQKISYATSPAFYLDCATYFFKHDRKIALRVLSNLAELKLEDAPLLRVFAWRLLEAQELDLAIEIFTKVRQMRPEEPQSHRDLALALDQRFDRDKKVEDAVRAAEMYNQVIMGRWDRFPEIELIALMELNRLLTHVEKVDKKSLKKLEFIDKRLRKLLDLDIRITMSWDADNTDMDLHVIEPSNEEAFYGHRLTTIGGLVSRDITQGYGPEEYVIHHAMPGSFKIRVKYFGSRVQTLMGPVTVSVNVITNFGRANEKHQHLTLRLTGAQELIDIGTIMFGKDAKDEVKLASLTREILKKLKRGMRPEEVSKTLGEPESRDGGSLVVYLYRLNDGTQIRLGFGPDLLWAKEILDGAEREISLNR